MPRERMAFAETAAPSPEAQPEPAAPEAPKPTVYVVAPGLSIVNLRGTLDAGSEVSERDFLGGKNELDELVACGAIVKA